MNNFNEILKQITKDIAADSSKRNIEDKQLLCASEKENSTCGEQYDRRDFLYADLLDKYIQSYKSKTAWNKGYKLVFFVISMLVFTAIIAVSLVALYIVAKRDNHSPSDIATVLSSMVGIVSSIIVLPRIIAEHLFPTNEDGNMIDMVKNMQLNDSKIRNSCLPEKTFKKNKKE